MRAITSAAVYPITNHSVLGHTNTYNGTVGVRIGPAGLLRQQGIRVYICYIASSVYQLQKKETLFL